MRTKMFSIMLLGLLTIICACSNVKANNEIEEYKAYQIELEEAIVDYLIHDTEEELLKTIDDFYKFVLDSSLDAEVKTIQISSLKYYEDAIKYENIELINEASKLNYEAMNLIENK